MLAGHPTLKKQVPLFAQIQQLVFCMITIVLLHTRNLMFQWVTRHHGPLPLISLSQLDGLKTYALNAGQNQVTPLNKSSRQLLNIRIVTQP